MYRVGAQNICTVISQPDLTFGSIVVTQNDIDRTLLKIFVSFLLKGRFQGRFMRLLTRPRWLFRKKINISPLK